MDPSKQPLSTPGMDVQPPKQPVADVTSSQPVAEAPPVEPTTQVTDAPMPATAEPSETAPLSAAPTAATAKHKSPKLVIIIAVLVGVLLAVIAVIGYKNTDKQASTGTNQQSSQQSTATQETVTASDVDSTEKDIDSALSETNDATDFDTTSLSDESLSL